MIPFQREFSAGCFNSTINFDKEKYGIKPDPFYGFSHDPYVQSSDNPERLEEIVKAKKKQCIMSKTSANGFYDNNSKIMEKYKNNPNAINFQKQNKNCYNEPNVNSLGAVGQLNLEGNEANINNSEVKRMNRTSSCFRPLKKTYEEKLDIFMERNNLKYIEPPKVEKTPPQQVVPEPQSVQSTVSNKGKKINPKAPGTTTVIKGKSPVKK